MSDHTPIYSKTELDLKISYVSKNHAAALSAVKTASFNEGLRKGGEEKIAELKQTVETLESEMAAKEKEHEAILEEMITKLDDFEADHNEKLTASNAAVEQKDVVLNAFSEQLQAAKLSSQKFKDHNEALTTENVTFKEQIAVLQSQVDSMKIKVSYCACIPLNEEVNELT